MNPIFQYIRVGKKYRLVNYGEMHEVFVLKRLGDDNFLVKSLLTMEQFKLKELVQYGVGGDFRIDELGY